MASPQTENGYTAIANELLEALARIRIPGEARQVLDVIMRKTYGFKKKQDYISGSQLVEATGMNKQNVWRATQKLLAMKLVIKNDYSDKTFYSLEKDYSKWVPSSKTITRKKVIKKETVVINNDYKSNPKRRTQKKKENIQKKPRESQSDSGVDSRLIVKVIDAFGEVNPANTNWFGIPPQRNAAGRLILREGLEKVLAVIKILPKTNAMAYFPSITTPVQLENEWAKLESKLRQHKDKSISKGRGFVTD